MKDGPFVTLNCGALTESLRSNYERSRQLMTEVYDEMGALAPGATAAQRRELQAILGEILLDLQREGRVMVTLERQQPVYHMTVAR